MAAFYVTTPIYYVNDRPHIGTAYSTIAADVLARYHRMRGQPTRFLTGLDEHGLKLERRATEKNMKPQAFVDSMAPPFREAWTQLRCEFDDFIRTTEPRHKERAQAMWKRCVDAGDIYQDEYEGLYCVGCEAYYTEKDLLEGNLCPQHKKPVETLKERSYFFKLSAYTDRLLKFYEENPNFVRPQARLNEVKSFVSEGLRDISISRSSFSWGVAVPDDPEHVMYVWFDALTNYISSLSGPPADGENPELFNTFWPGDATAVHLVGKDILRFHAVYWPAFLMSAGLEPPSQVWAHGWLTVDGAKMSKSTGNFIPPGPLVDAVGADVLRYYLMRDVAFGQDGDFSHTNLFERYQGDLGNGLGNLLHRIIAIAKRNLDGAVPPCGAAESLQDLDRELIGQAQRSAKVASEQMDAINPNRALDAVWELVAAANKYVDQTEPWNLAKTGDTQRLGEVAYTVMESLRWLGLMLWPFMPDKCDALRTQLGLTPLDAQVGNDEWPSEWGGLTSGTALQPGDPLFPRFDPKDEAALIEKLIPKAPEAAADVPPPPSDQPAVKEDIVFDDFMKLDLRIGLIKSAEKVPKSSKLLKLMVDVGSLGERQILAGIGKNYKPEDLLGKQVVIVANLPPRKMMGLESQGMVLAAGDGKNLAVLNPTQAMPPGSPVS